MGARDLNKNVESIPKMLVRHYVDGRMIRAYKLRGRQTAIGSSRFCRIRIPTENVSGVACLIEKTADGWLVTNFENQPKLKLNNKEFVEEIVSEPSTVEFGNNRIVIQPISGYRKLFTQEREYVEKGNVLHVVRWHKQIIDTTPSKDVVKFYQGVKESGIEVESFPLPVPKQAGHEKFQIDPNLRKPLIATITSFILFLALLLVFSNGAVEEKPKENIYTRMIYDGKILTQKRKQLVGIPNPKGTGAGNGSISEGAKGGVSSAEKAVKSLRQAGIQSIIGKIAIRASKNATFIASLGQDNGNQKTKNLGQMESPSDAAAQGRASVAGKGFKVGGIGTGGKGGGVGGYKDGTGLGTGAIGNGQVGMEDGDSVVDGGLDRDVIAGVIREHLGQIRYCYERELAANPKLAGKIKVKFSIDAGGAVETQSVSQTTLNNAMVEECILRRIATWKFPKPRGGLKVLVSYPFLFKSVN